MSEQKPVRWSSSPDLAPELRKVLQSAAADEPDVTSLRAFEQRVLARTVGERLDAGASDEAGGTPQADGDLAAPALSTQAGVALPVAKLALVLAVLVGVGIAALSHRPADRQVEAPQQQPPNRPVAGAAAAPAAQPAAERAPVQPLPSPSSAADTTQPSPVRKRARPQKAEPSQLAREVAMVRRMRELVRSAPCEALALAETYRKTFASPLLAAERDQYEQAAREQIAAGQMTCAAR